MLTRPAGICVSGSVRPISWCRGHWLQKVSISPSLIESLLGTGSKNGLGGMGGGDFPVSIIEETMFVAGDLVTSAPNSAPSVLSCAMLVGFSDAAGPVLLDKQATYRLLTFLSALGSWLKFIPATLLTAPLDSLGWRCGDVFGSRELLSTCSTSECEAGRLGWSAEISCLKAEMQVVEKCGAPVTCGV